VGLQTGDVLPAVAAGVCVSLLGDLEGDFEVDSASLQMLLETLDLGIMADVGSATETGKGNRAARFLSCALLLRLLLFLLLLPFWLPVSIQKVLRTPTPQSRQP